MVTGPSIAQEIGVGHVEPGKEQLGREKSPGILAQWLWELAVLSFRGGDS